MINIDEISVLDLELRDLLASLEKENALPRVRAPGRKKRMIGLDDKVTVTVVTNPEVGDQIFEELRSKEEIEISGTKGVYIVTLPVRALRHLEKIDEIEAVEASAEVFLPRLNCARDLTGVDALQSIRDDKFPEPLTGRNVIIATVDSGLDWWHGDFRQDDGKTRVGCYAWWDDDEEDDSDVREVDLNTKRSEPQNVYKAEAINQALDGSRYIPYRDPRGHGTHCMSIAAGNGRASGDGIFSGVAPEATIMALGTTSYPPVVVKWGIENFFDMAEACGQPSVISLSVGGHFGSHDGKSMVEKVIQRESGPGRIVVVAAGNEAEDGIHWQGDVSMKEEAEIPVRIVDDSYQWVEVWIPEKDKVEAWVETPDRVQYRHSLEDPTETVFGKFKLTQGRQNKNRRVFLRIYNGRLNKIWRIRVRVREGGRIEDGRIHAWGGTDEPETSYHLFPSTLANECTVCIPATVEEAIVVGSFVSQPDVVAPRSGIKNVLSVDDLSPFSSHGPTRGTKKKEGLQKPDIVAPGQYITAALASDSVMATADRYRPRRHETKPYLSIQGTSMSAPFMAGVVALMLQRCSTLTPKDVRELLKESARTPEGVEFDEDKWHRGFGYGLLDTEALFKELFKRLECH